MKNKYFRRNVFPAFVFFLTCLQSFVYAEGSNAERAWVLDTLKRYSPDGYFILDTYDREVSEGTPFMDYWDGPEDDRKWSSLNTIVHEMAHGYMGEIADFGSTYYYISPTKSIMVPIGKVYRTNSMASSIPEELRTFRYSYVESNEEFLGSQVNGAYGLMNEMAAYYVGTKAAADMQPLFEARGVTAPWADFFNSVYGTLYGILEFRYFILKYILWAKDNDQAVYKDILANGKFKTAFASIDQTSRDFVDTWLKGSPALYGKIRKAGVTFEVSGDSVFFGSGDSMTGSSTFMGIYELLRREMLKPAYTQLLSALYEGKTPAVWPDSGVTPAEKGGYEPRPEDAAEGEGPLSFGDSSEYGEPSAGAMPGQAAQSEVKAPTGKLNVSLEGKDRKGDAKKPFADIVKASVEARGDGLVLRLELAFLPQTLPFDQADLGEGSVEYEWGFDIDPDGDGEGDYSVSLSSFKGGKKPPGEYPILTRCFTELWKIESNSATAIEVPIKAEIDGNAIIFTLNDSTVFPAASINQESLITAKTYCDDGNTQATDYMDL